MKGVLSQGLILPMSSIVSQYGISSYYEGMDLTETLGIVKYEPPIPAQLAGLIKGNFPSFVPKTDQTRIQSLGKELNSWIENNLSFEISEKNDGSSMTLLINDGEIQVCSRNLSLKEDYNNTFWKVAIDEKLIDKIKDYYEETKNNIALQFELIGPKIQSNPYKLDKFKATLFDIFDIDQQCYLTSEKRIEFCQKYNIEHIKVIDNNFVMTSDITIDKLLEMAEGKSYLNSKTEREGLVFKCLTDSSITFKAISNKFLLKGI
jgi:RNA ligase (TIGR02306 family)